MACSFSSYTSEDAFGAKSLIRKEASSYGAKLLLSNIQIIKFRQLTSFSDGEFLQTF